MNRWHICSKQPRTKAGEKVELLLFLLLHHVVQASNMGQDFHREFVTTVEGQLGFATPANTGRCSGDTMSLR